MNEQFEKDKICYEQHSESFRNLNNQMWQVPIIAMTVDYRPILIQAFHPNLTRLSTS